ncbi:ABC transporter permease [Thermotoga sp. Ku-13t]|uniref:ABC transporter permease subunit n=1 Tax=Thermotoga sp. Ku-13t TaxID=1755813 RepID=UPI0013EAB484|nr:ABC transporter permease subunit [Thermotoga sp. Ku-13t]KAF2957868.1 ABC transporter permease [Thermotoga sp. Ku-13t]
MNVYSWEMKHNIKSTMIWSVVLIALLIMYAAVYPSMTKDAELINRFMKLMPRAFLRIFGLEDFDISNILHYLATISSIYVTLLGSVFSALVVVKLVAREESEKTAEFLLSKPLGRKSILAQKLLAIFSSILILDAILSLASFFVTSYFGSESLVQSKFWLFWFSQLLLHITVSSIVLCFICSLKRQDSAVSLSIGIVFVLYIFSMIAKLTEKAKFLGYFTPFYYSDGVRIIRYGSMEPIFLALHFILIIASLSVSFITYSRKDIYV